MSVADAVAAAADVLVSLAHEDYGFYAAGVSELAHQDHYTSVWARDCAHTIIGVGDCGFAGEPAKSALVAASRASLLTLIKTQYGNGQIASVVWPVGIADTGGVPYFDCGETGGVDAGSLFVIALHEHLSHHDDAGLREQAVPAVHRAVQWLTGRDMNQEGLIDSPQAGDWMDSTLVRSGKTLYNNVLFYRALVCAAELCDHDPYFGMAADLNERINFAFWPQPGTDWRWMVAPLGAATDVRDRGRYPHPARQAAFAAAARPDRAFYLSHIEYASFVDKCDVLANVLAVLYDIAEPDRAAQIMAALHEHSQKLAAPISTYLEPIQADDPAGMYKQHADRFQGERWRNRPGDYHNAGIWPYIGGYYVCALAKVGMVEQAEAELIRLCACGLETQFNEWLNFSSGDPGGNPRQAWNAALLVRAAAAVEALRPGR
jgi:Amylo-alpha-1,6-glucosidase